ncbi:hypothetical protein [Streptosporangium carneum]|uniref:Lipoprotein n=1 Tax=Streptosporangium carneum TaxID=47481 RepID=A0A9W6HVB0_9ACTN|nr:hypothetical protein [Streptosporangium carneum]GLK07006.1 hypothetical protein GCM10017600_04110 [Streptosporangium carneum]
MRRGLGILLAAAVIMSATGCTPVGGGLTGVGVDAEGHPIIVLAWCDGAAPEHAIVFRARGSAGTAPQDDPSDLPGGTASAEATREVRFNAPSLDGNSASFRLDAPADGWAAESEPLVLEAGVTYNARGWKGSGYTQVSTQDVSFTAGDVAELKPGQVLVQQLDEKTQAIRWIDAVISREEFDRQGRDPASCE